MSRNNTGNPIGSKAFPDFEDNVKNLDEAVNTADPQWVDRLGRFRLPLMEQERQFVASQDSREDQFQSSQDYREDQFQLSQDSREGRFHSAQSSREAVFSDFLQGSGYQDLGEYAPGIEITAHNQYVTFGGQPYLLKPSIPVPYTTSGEWTGDDFKLIGDDSLRQDLANPGMGAAMVARGVVAVDSIADLLALPEGQRKVGLRYLVKGYHAGTDIGGGEFYYDPSRQAENDSGMILGGFVRIIAGYVTPSMFGARGDGVADDTLPIQSALDMGGKIIVESGTYLINTERTGTGEGRAGLQINKSGTTLTSSGDVVFQSIPRTGRWGSILIIASGVSDVIVEGGKFVGTKYDHPYDQEWEYGITVWVAHRVTIRDLSITDMAGDGINFYWPRDTDFSTINGVLVDNCDISNCRRHELTFLAGVDITIRGCRLYKTSDVKDGIINNTYGGLNVDIEGFAYQTVRNVRFIDTYFSCPTNYAFRADQKGSQGTRGLLMQNCVVESIGVDGPGGFEFVNCDDVSVIGCTFRGLSSDYDGDNFAVSFQGCTNSRVRNNYIVDCPNGIRVAISIGGTIRPSSNTAIEGNILDGLDGRYGISVGTRGGSSVVSGNEIRPSCRFQFQAIRIAGDTEEMSSIVLTDNLVSGHLPAETGGNAIYVAQASDLVFRGNSLRVVGVETVRLVRLLGVLTGTVQNNHFNAKSDVDYMLEVNDVQNLLIGDNYFTRDAGVAASAVIWFRNNTTGLIVKGNTWKGAANSNTSGSVEGVLKVLNTQVDGSLDSAV